MDGSVKIYDAFREKSALCSINHTGGVKDCHWNHDGHRLISGGFDKKVTLSDISTGTVTQTYDHPEYIATTRFHATDPNVFLSGMFKGGLLAWDIRSNQIVRTYSRFFGQVQDLQFLPDSKFFMTCSDFVLRNASDKSIVVWDYDSGTVHSNQIYQEGFSCTCLSIHPNQHCFVAQTNGNYIAIFNMEKPWKMNQRKRFEGHQVSGYHIQCNFSLKGKYVATGSADGSLYFYDWSTSRPLKIIKNAHREAA
ncbi:WD40 repeat-like protein, partial [Basidiobolus meristosporus CBS 931.73]